MSLLHAIILGIIQGLTEIFPVSSSAHLVIFPWLFNVQYQGVAFDVALHLGTALAFIVYFFKDWIDILRAAFTKQAQHTHNLFWCIVIGTIPAAVAGVLLEKKADSVFRSPLLIAAMLSLFAGVLWLADYFGKKSKSIEQINVPSALTIGLAQALALIPGVSRSGITITAGLFKGLSREAAARFSFLLSTPVIIAAGGLKLLKLQVSDCTPAFVLAIVCSAVSGYLAIHFLMNFVKRTSFKVFVFYRIALSIVILAVFCFRR